VLQPVIQFGTAIHGKGLSGGALNGVQKHLRVQKFTSPSSRKVQMKSAVSVRILANGAICNPVAAVTRRWRIKHRRQVTALILAAKGTRLLHTD
jgi:hypothetical protein